jgi:hypothetical protein
MEQGRSSRERRLAGNFVADQSEIHWQAEALLSFRRALNESSSILLPNSVESDEEKVEEEFEEEEEEEEKKADGMEEETTEWSSSLKAVSLPSDPVPACPARGCRRLQSAIEFFRCIISESFITGLADETNRYARQQASASAFAETTPSEISAFLAVNIAMGIAPLPEWHMYWSDEWKNPFISAIMSRNRFGDLLRFFHISNNAASSSSADPLHKIRPLLREINRNSPAFYHSSQHLAVDEAMIAFKGRNVMKQFMKGKPTRWGFRGWLLADCEHPYALAVDIYTGKCFHPRSEPLAKSVVSSLTKDIEYQRKVLCMDNFFSGKRIASLWLPPFCLLLSFFALPAVLPCL